MIEDQLHDLATLDVDLPAGLAHAAWKRGRRQHRQAAIAGAGAGVLALAGGLTATALTGTTNTRATQLVPAETLTAPAAAATAAAPVPSALACVGAVQPLITPAPVPSTSLPACRQQPVSSPGALGALTSGGPSPSTFMLANGGCADNFTGGCKDPVLKALALPNPAPGFTMKRSEPAAGPTPAPVVTPLVTPVSRHPQVFVNATDVYNPYAVTMEVAVRAGHAGAFEVAPVAGNVIDSRPVTGTTTARGVTAYEVDLGDNRDALYLQSGGLDLEVIGTPTPAGPAVPVSELVAVVDALENVPG